MEAPKKTGQDTVTSSYPMSVLQEWARFSDRVAFVHQGRRMTYGEALACVYRFARVLASLNLGRGDGLAVLAGNQPHQLLARLAAQLLGCREIVVEGALSAPEQAHILRDSGATAFVYAPDLYAAQATELLALADVPVVLSLGPAVLGADLLELAVGVSDAPVLPCGEPTDLARLVYTGGSTGRSKGCCHTFESLSDHWAWQPKRWSPEVTAVAQASRRYLVTGASAGAAGNDFMALALLSGGTVYLHDAFDAGATLQTIESERITAMFVGTAKFNPLLDHELVDTTDLSSLRAVVFAGSAITTQRFREAIDRFGPFLYQAYGQSEAGLISMLAPEEATAAPQRLLSSAGRPQPGVELVVQDADGGRLEVGEVGEICLRAPWLMTGYWKRPELVGKAFRDGWLHTGDLGYLDAEGYLYLVDRVKDMVIVRGENCFSRGIEDVLTHHPDVREAAVIGVPHDIDGEAVHAVVVPMPDRSVAESELRELVRAELSPLHAPKTIEFTEQLPLTSAGKVDKKRLREPFWGKEERQIR